MNTIICGLDEAGRGALAGPIVAAAVILTEDAHVIAKRSGAPLRDSKTLSKRQRENLYEALIQSQSTILSMHINAELINKHGIGWANKEIFRMLIRKIPANEYIIDGNLKIAPIPENPGTIRCVVDADATIETVMFAGIVAKVTRDRIMVDLHTKYPHYGWEHNAGYGTKEHISQIRIHGVTHEHRTAFVYTALHK